MVLEIVLVEVLRSFLEYIPGGSVAVCLRDHGKFEDQIVRSFTGQTLDGLKYLHDNNIIHRVCTHNSVQMSSFRHILQDLKTDNIYVDPWGICKISDFGISKRTVNIYENDAHTPMQESLKWMAPEVFHTPGEFGYSGKVDIWSLGCVVLEMWAGVRPWQIVDAVSVIFEVQSSPDAPPYAENNIIQLGAEAEDFRRKCFASNPDERPSATELQRHPYLTLRPDWFFEGFK